MNYDMKQSGKRIQQLRIQHGYTCQRQSENIRKRQRNFVVFWGVIGIRCCLAQKSVNDLLFLPHKFLVFFQAVGFAFDVGHGTVMRDSIQDTEAMVTSAKTSFRREKVSLEVKTVEAFS